MSRNNQIKLKELMNESERIRNICICAHVDHGKTTLSDNLLAYAGLISHEDAGTKLSLDFNQDEGDRGITIDAANVTMAQKYNGEDYLINLIDTPGHIDFGGDVTRAMRAVDGAIVVVCAVDGIKSQTERVVRQALKENVKPVLFINKVDRLINELNYTEDQLKEKFVKILVGVNKLIKNMAPKDKRDEWQLNLADGSVALGSAKSNWAISVPAMQETGITFKEIVQYCRDDNQDELATKIPLTDVLLNMVVEHLPSPDVAQSYRIPKIWKGDLESVEGKSMLNTSKDGPLAAMITNVTINKQAGAVSTCRIYSGTLKTGSEVYLVGSKQKARTQQVGVFLGAKRQNAGEVPAGNIAYITGIKNATAGETLCFEDNKIEEFESIEHISQPIVTVAIEAKKTRDLPKLIEVLRNVGKTDPTIKVTINEETGEQLMSGMGELHLEVMANRIRTIDNLDIVTSEPIVVYRESILGTAGPVEGKSPNKHNRFYIEVEPLDENILNALIEGDLKEGRIKSKEMARDFIELGMDKEEARRVWDVYNRSMFLNMTRGIQHLDEVKELVLEEFESALGEGPLAGEELMGLKFKLVDAKLHEDAVHRGPAQINPAIRKAIYGSIMLANPVLLEPVQKVCVTATTQFIGGATRECQNRRGIMVDNIMDGDMSDMEFEVPVSEMFGFAGAIRSATGGVGSFTAEMKGFKLLPQNLQHDTIREIRQRKGLSQEPFAAEHYLG